VPKTSAAAHASSSSVGTGTEADLIPVLRLRLHGFIPPLPSCDFMACTGNLPIPILLPNVLYIVPDVLQDGSGYSYAVYYNLLSLNFNILKA